MPHVVGGDFVAKTGIKAALRRCLGVTLLTLGQRYIVGPMKRRRNNRKSTRYLEIGPGPIRILGFETINITGGPQVDYIGDATKRLPFPDDSFDLVYASHVLEHTAWYRSCYVLSEWVRVIKPGGTLELWVPDALKIAEAFVAAERNNSRDYYQDGWWRFNEQRDPCVWASGRTYSYGDGTGTRGHFNWHLALFSERYLLKLFQDVGLTDVRIMLPSEVRGYDHGWINLGVSGRKLIRRHADLNDYRPLGPTAVSKPLTNRIS